MGVDIYGNNENHEDGNYFRANWWGWRPILAVCDYVIEANDLHLSTDCWDSNEGGGLASQEDCTELATCIDTFLDQIDEEHETVYANFGFWKYTNIDNKTPPIDVMNKLNQQYPIGTLLYRPIALDDDIGNGEEDTVHPDHLVDVPHIQEFSLFLKHCGGFAIW